jgi:hypothetical protein
MKTLLALILLSSGFNVLADNTSVYTSIAKADCRTIEDSELEKQPEIDFYTGHCRGKGGYTVVISGGDLRYSLSLLVSGRVVELTRLGRFHDLGSTKVEWRGPTNSNIITNLIYRLNVSNQDGKDSSYLYVVRLDGVRSCVIGVVPPGPNMNLRAREIADAELSTCVSKSRLGF